MTRKRRSVYDMPRKELEARVIATVKQAIIRDARRVRRRWVGSRQTDAIVGSSIPTHRNGVYGTRHS